MEVKDSRKKLQIYSINFRGKTGGTNAASFRVVCIQNTVAAENFVQTHTLLYDNDL